MSRMDNSGKSPRISTPGRPSPRKLPLYSPSELSPFSFNEDSLKILATDIEQQNGLIPLNIPLGGSGGAAKCFSQPQTPSEERRSIVPDSFLARRLPPSSPLNSSSYPRPPASPGLSHSHSFGGQSALSSALTAHQPALPSSLAASHSLGASCGGTPGKTMRDYDESFKEMKKENFNLKLRIFFLEERLGLGKKTTAEELANANLELKIQLETCKQDLLEKNVLLTEASEALEDLESQVESQKLVIRGYEQESCSGAPSAALGPGAMFELGSVPNTKNKKPTRSPDVSRKPLMSPKISHKNYFFGQDDMKNVNSSKDNVLAILKEDEEVSEESDSKRREYLTKIQQLEKALKLSQDAQQQMTEDLARLSSRVRPREVTRECGTQTRASEEREDVQTAGSGLAEECHGLKSDNRKLRDQLKLQVQERKLLLKKISMLKEQLGSVSESEHKTLPVTTLEQCRPPTSCADIGTQCDGNHCDEAQDDSDNRNFSTLEERNDNPLSDTSTWNTELPNIADVHLCSSPELLFDSENAEKSEQVSEGLSNTLIGHLSQQLESCKSDLAAKVEYIANLEEDLAAKDELIKDQSEAVAEYREELGRVEDSLYQPGLCSRRHRQAEARRRTRRRPRRSPAALGQLGVARDSVDTDEWSQPDTGVSIARIGLPLSYPEQAGPGSCGCDGRGSETEDTEDNANKKFYSLDFSHVDQEDSDAELAALPLPITDYSSIIEELRSHRQEIRKLHKECSGPGLGEVECNSNMCLASGNRVLESLLATLLHEVSILNNLDSGVDTSEENENDKSSPYADQFSSLERFSLCSGCTSSIPKEFDELLKSTHLGLSSAVGELEKLKRKFTKIANKNKQLVMKDKDDVVKAEEAKTRLNENYILIAKLSSENLRLLGEYSKLESSAEELKKISTDLELRLQDEISTANTRLLEKEQEAERLQHKMAEVERRSGEMTARVEQLQRRLGHGKMSPDTSSSFDFFPAAAVSSADTFRPRAFSAVSSGSQARYGSSGGKLAEVSSPDLGVDLVMESDIYSSLERGHSQKVGSLAFEKIVHENRALRHERELLNQKLGKSKVALQETLVRLSRSNMAKQEAGAASPSLQRHRGLSQSRSQGGLGPAASRGATLERDLSLPAAAASLFGSKHPSSGSGSQHKNPR